MAIEPGRILHERYRLVRPLGQGSQAAVWVADHLALSTQVAVKLIDPELAKQESARDRFRREATAAAQLRSAHVVQILDHGIDGIQPFIVMELLDGEDLYERITSRGRLTLREASKVVTQVSRALVRAHAAGIVHRDLKPENIFLVSNEDDEVVKVLDFGVAKIHDPAKATMQRTGIGTLIGTPHYMSPEQVKGITEVDHRTDLWALGVIAYQCVTGEMPFDSEGVGDLLIKISMGEMPVPSRVVPTLPAAFDAWFARACERDLTKRFQTARDLALALATVVGPEGKPSVRPPAPDPLASDPGGLSPHGLMLTPTPAIASLPPARPSPSRAVSDPFDFGGPDSDPPIAPDAIVQPSRGRGTPRERDDATQSTHTGFPLLVRSTPVPSYEQPISPLASLLPTDDGPVSAHHQPFAPVAAWPPPPRTAMPPSPPPRPVPVVVPPSAPPPRMHAPPARIPSDRPPAQRRSTVSGLATTGSTHTDPPPELDGAARRRRLLGVLALTLLVGTVVVVAGVVESQLAPTSNAGAPDGSPAPAWPPVPATSPVPAPAPTPSASSVDPGKPTRPARLTPTVKGPMPTKGPLPTKSPGPTRGGGDDGTIVIPLPE